MLTVIVTIFAFIAALTLLSVGILLKKRTPLKGSCGSGANARTPSSKEHVCECCSCDKVPDRQ